MRAEHTVTMHFSYSMANCQIEIDFELSHFRHSILITHLMSIQWGAHIGPRLSQSFSFPSFLSIQLIDPIAAIALYVPNYLNSWSQFQIWSSDSIVSTNSSHSWSSSNECRTCNCMKDLISRHKIQSYLKWTLVISCGFLILLSWSEKRHEIINFYFFVRH